MGLESGREGALRFLEGFDRVEGRDGSSELSDEGSAARFAEERVTLDDMSVWIKRNV